jgi:outer membrane protein OmpA-like peptidoglycan-associated protein
MSRLISMLAALLVLHGCSTPPRPDAPSAAPPGSAAAPAATAPGSSTLAVESRWLKSWFEGTPVVIQQGNASSLSIDVPREFSFDSGQSKVKPPLAAVLDKVSQSLRRMPAARLDLVAAPGDGTSPSPLAQQRANQVRAQLLGRGVPASQLGKATSTTATAVQLRIELASP